MFILQAGIEKNRLTLVLEPEAAAVCCKHLELQKSNTGQEALLGVYEPGSQFLVCDLGGKYYSVITVSKFTMHILVKTIDI
jgi:hypothetical protein